MTQPAPPQQQTAQQVAQQPAQQTAAAAAAEAALIAEIAALLATATLSAATEVAALLARLPLEPGRPRPRITPAAAHAAARLILATPLDTARPRGPASHATQRLNLLRRAQYTVNAARRLTHATLNPTTTAGRHRTPWQRLAHALRQEHRYLRQHRHATRNRARAAEHADTVGRTRGAPDPTTRRPGVIVGWYATLDDRTSSECRAAHGSNFRLTEPPAIGLPGTVHPHCRCTAGPPWPTRRTTTGPPLPTVPRRT